MLIQEQTILPRWDRGVLLAVDLHRDQTRRDGTPYIGHLLQVAGLVIGAGGDEDTALGAVLHDAIEDQWKKDARQRIKDQCGETVLALVEACTEEGTGSDKPKLAWRPRKEAYIQQFATLELRPLLIRVADKLQNVSDSKRQVRASGDEHYREFARKDYETLTERKAATLWFYHACLDAAWARYGVLVQASTQDGAQTTESEKRMLMSLGALLWDLDETVKWLEER